MSTYKSINNAQHLQSKSSNDSNKISLEERKKLLRKRVLTMLKDPNPVNGIYAMYGAHKNPPIQCRKK